jgi:arylsulfatase A
MRLICPLFCSYVHLVLLVTMAVGQQPNVVVLLADDLGSKDIGCYGGPVKTPALDELAAKGVRFTDFHSGAPVCSPARATLLTGRHHLRTGVYTVIQDHIHNMHLRNREVTIAELLKANGYDTVHLGKWHLGTPFRGMKKPWIDEHGFDYWFATDLNAAPSHRDPSNFWRNRERVGELKGYACQLVIDEAISWLDEKRDTEKPFFLNIWFHEPHAPLAAPDNLVSQYGDLNDPAAIYSGTIDNTDRAIARLLKKLEDFGSLENTIIIYTSDHGSYRPDRNGGLRGNKGSLFEGGIRTPGIICWPKGIKGGRIEDTPAGAVDLLPTICGLTGIKKPEGVHLDGADLSPLLAGKEADFKRRQPLTWHSPTSQPIVAIRDGKYSLVGYRKMEYPRDQDTIRAVVDEMKVILENKHDRKLTQSELWHKAYNSHLNTPEWNRLRGKFVLLNTFQEAWIPLIKAGSGGVSRFELYDLSTDPNQQHNVAERFPEVTKRLKEEVLTINADVLKEAADWSPYKTIGSSSTKPIPKQAFDDAELEKLLSKIEIAALPSGYDPSKHQDYVDERMKSLQSRQRGRIGLLWKEKRRLHPNMKNAGMSFVRILEYVAAGETSIEERTRIHRLATTKRSTFDAFAYVNRLPEKSHDEETAEDFAGRVLGRLANQEGRILLKTPPGMDMQAYEGLKLFLEYQGANGVGNCAACHIPPDFSDGKSHVVKKAGSAKPTPSLRNLVKRRVDLRKALLRKLEASQQKRSSEAKEISDNYSAMNFTEQEIPVLIAFLKLLDDLSDERFRELVLHAEVLNTLEESSSK